jgi:hypothetical protein
MAADNLPWPTTTAGTKAAILRMHIICGKLYSIPI